MASLAPIITLSWVWIDRYSHTCSTRVKKKQKAKNEKRKEIYLHVFFISQMCLFKSQIFFMLSWSTEQIEWAFDFFFFFFFTCFRFGVWEAAKWVARVRERTIYDSKRPILLNLTTDIVEENRYLQCKESALEAAFLIKAMES